MKHLPFTNNQVEQYFRQLQPEIRELLLQAREAVLEVLPNAVEVIKYGIPTYVVTKNVVHLAGWKNHIGFYPGPGCIKAHEAALKPYKQSKGTIQFALDEALPLDLIQAMTRYNYRRILGITD